MDLKLARQGGGGDCKDHQIYYHVTETFDFFT